VRIRKYLISQLGFLNHSFQSKFLVLGVVGSDRIRNSGKSGSELSLRSLSNFSSLGLGDSLLWSVLGLSGFSKNSSVWVKSGHQRSVLQWILLGGSLSSWLLLGRSQSNLNFVRVDDLGNIWLGENSVFQVIVSSLKGFSSESTELGVQSLKGSLGPDNESSEMSTWGKSSDVQSVNVKVVNTWDVSNSSGEGFRIVVTNDQRSSSVLPSSVSKLTLTGSDNSSSGNSFNIGINSISGEDSGDISSLGNSGEFIRENQWQLWNTLDGVTSGHNQWGNGG